MKNKPYIIAEISGNHNGRIKNLLFLIKKAKEIGADAVKIQTFKPERMALKKNKNFIINSKNTTWNKKSLFNIYLKTSVPYEWHNQIFNYGKKVGIKVFSSPFSSEDVIFLEKFKPPFYKIASLENTNYPLLKKIGKTKRKVFLSTGTASKKELAKSIEILKKNGSKDIILLKCITDYPANPGDYNLKTLLDMKSFFKCEIGISDHTIGPTVSILSTLFGAKYFEKHICLDIKNNNDIDSFYSTSVKEFKNYVKYLKESVNCIGEVNYGNTKAELQSKKRRRKIFFFKNLKKGAILQEKDIYGLRASKGITIDNYEKFVNKKLKINVKKNQLLQKKYFI